MEQVKRAVSCGVEDIVAQEYHVKQSLVHEWIEGRNHRSVPETHCHNIRPCETHMVDKLHDLMDVTSNSLHPVGKSKGLAVEVCWNEAVTP